MRYLEPSSIVIYEEQKDENDLRIKNMLEPYQEGNRYDVGIVGVPFDYGVELSKGRVGAKGGPDAVRKALKKYGTAYNIERKIDLGGLKVCDFGDVEVLERDSEGTHLRVSDVVARIIKGGIVPVVIGGGHDISFANVRGLCDSVNAGVGGINIDAHFDVRKVVNGRATSGTAFRRIIEELDGRAEGRNFVEIGAHDNLNSRIYHEYLMHKNVSVVTLNEIRKRGMPAVMIGALKRVDSEADASFVSIDMDSMPQHIAPGCSAPSADGIETTDILDACFIAGADRNLKLLDIMEINPKYDVDSRTAILAATMIVSFLNGFATRRK